MFFEYRLVPAPRRAAKIKAARPGAERLARTVEQVINEQAAEGWHYLRSDVLPSEERQGLSTKRTTKYHTFLVFQRPIQDNQNGVAPDDLNSDQTPVADPDPIESESVHDHEPAADMAEPAQAQTTDNTAATDEPEPNSPEHSRTP